MSKNNFDQVAWIYDTLVKFVFGDRLMVAQHYFLPEIEPGSSVMIAGGGTGEILEALNELDRDLRIVYIEPSKEMIRIAGKRGPFRNLKIDFKPIRLQELEPQKFDVIITNFFLDIFTEFHVKEIIRNISESVTINGKWIITDFENTSVWWHRVLIRTMYIFFRWFSNLEGDKLISFDKYLTQYGCTCVSEKIFMRGLIKSRVMKKIFVK